MSKRIVHSTDGTWDDPATNSNVVILHNALEDLEGVQDYGRAVFQASGGSVLPRSGCGSRSASIPHSQTRLRRCCWKYQSTAAAKRGEAAGAGRKPASGEEAGDGRTGVQTT